MKTQFILVVSLVVLMIGGFPFSVMSQSAAKVENINFYAEGTNLIVTYDIVKAKPGETFNVWIKIVTASGNEITPNTLIGNFGSGNSGGTGKKISWNVDADRVTLDEEFAVEVFARPEKKEEVKVEEKEKIEPIIIPAAAGSLKAADVFVPEKNNFYWLGVDYSHVKLQVELEPEVVKTQFFNVWNDLFVKEADKYNIKEMLKLPKISNDLTAVKSFNMQAETGSMKATLAPNYTVNDISSFVGSYPPFTNAGIGIVFIAEFLNRNKEEAFYHVVAIDLTTRQVLLSERFRGEVGGVGFRNNWANTVYSVIEQFKKNYKNLKIKYSK